MPEIRRLGLLEGAARAEGFAVIIDVLRAGSFACYTLGAGARRILAISEVEDALALKLRNPDWLLAGERGGEPPPGFDCGNSPAGLAGLDLSGRTVIHCTSAGTRGISAAFRSADATVVGCFANSGAVARSIREASPGVVSLVCMGTEGVSRADEDEAFADYLQACLEGLEADADAHLERVRSSPSGALFASGDRPGRPSRDLSLCADLDRFAFVPAVTGSLEGHPVLTRI
jgi:2-phosphosulfolactate phosphatase